MDPNVKLFESKSEVSSSGVERADQARANDHIGLGWSDKSKDNQRIEEWVDQR